MAEQIQMGAYRLVALSYNGLNPDKGAAVKSSRVAVLYVEKPLTQMATYRMVALTSNTRNPDIAAAIKAGRVGMLYVEAAVTQMATYRLNAIFSTTRNPDIGIAATAGRIAFLIKPPTMMANAGRMAFLINQQTTGPAAYVPQVFQKVFQQAFWPSVANTISTTTVFFNAQMVVQRRVDPLPQSNTRVSSVAQKTLQQTAIAFGQGVVNVYSNVMLALQSDLHEYVPVSMDYVMSLANLTIQQAPLPMWQSPHYVYSLAQQEIYRTPMGFLPRSTTTAFHVSLKLLQKDDSAYLPWSNTRVGTVALMHLFDYTSPLPEQGTNEVRQQAILALQHTNGEQGVVGPVRVAANAMTVLQQRTDPVVQSPTRAFSVAQLSLQETFYEAPENIGKTSALQNAMTVVAAETYPNPDIVQSTTRASQVLLKGLVATPPEGFPWSQTTVYQAGLEWLQRANYPTPGEMIPPTNAALVSQFGIKTLQVIANPDPQSDTAMLQMVQLTSQYLFYTPASDLASRGIFIGQMAEVISQTVVYPDPAEPVSPAFVTQMSVIAAYNDDNFADPTKEAQPGEAFQVVQTYASDVAYPDPTVSQVWAEVSLVFVQNSASESFPDPSVPVSSAELTQISIQDANNADYPDPANLVSPADVSQIVGQVSKSTAFPNPSKPASSLTVDQLLQMVAIPDVTLHGVPEYEIKHRPVITISIVYIQTS